MCLLIVAAYGVSLKWSVWHWGSSSAVALDRATLLYHDIRGPEKDVKDIISLNSTGWGMAPARALLPLWGQLSIRVGRPGESEGFRVLGFNVMGAFERVTVRNICVPLWMLLLVPAIPTWLLFRSDLRYIPPGHCHECGYNLTGNVSGRCSECGSTSRPVETRRFSFRRWLRRGRLALAAVILLGTAGLCLYAHLPVSPRILAIIGYDDVFSLDPLRVNQATLLGRLVPTNQIRTWDGTWLYANGYCEACWKPRAKKGSFVFAKLPNGLAYSKWDASAPEHSHLTQPHYLSLTNLFAAGTLMALVIAVAPNNLRRLAVRRRSLETPLQQASHDRWNAHAANPGR